MYYKDLFEMVKDILNYTYNNKCDIRVADNPKMLTLGFSSDDMDWNIRLVDVKSVSFRSLDDLSGSEKFVLELMRSAEERRKLANFLSMGACKDFDSIIEISNRIDELKAFI